MNGRPRAGLSPGQRRFLERFFLSGGPGVEFCLAGGTALAGFHLGHRWSEDLDLFVADPHLAIDLVEDVLPAVREIAEALGWEVVPRLAGTRHLRLEVEAEERGDRPPRRIDLGRLPAPLLDPPEERDGIRVATLRDLARGKLIATAVRPVLELKDVFDLYALDRVPAIDLLGLLDTAREADPRFQVVELSRRLEEVRRQEGQWPQFRREYIAWKVSFIDLVEFARNLARRLDRWLGPPRDSRRP